MSWLRHARQPVRQQIVKAAGIDCCEKPGIRLAAGDAPPINHRHPRGQRARGLDRDIDLAASELQLKIGTIDVQKLDNDPFVAIVIGAAGGFLGSDLLKLFMSFFRRSVGRASSSRASVEGGQTQARRAATRQDDAAPGKQK